MVGEFAEICVREFLAWDFWGIFCRALGVWLNVGCLLVREAGGVFFFELGEKDARFARDLWV